MALFSYGHENYIDDLQRKEQFIQKMQDFLPEKEKSKQTDEETA